MAAVITGAPGPAEVVVTSSVAQRPGAVLEAPEDGTFLHFRVSGSRPIKPATARYRPRLATPQEPAAVITECVGAMR
ncbi:hypothetical protein [Streptomyces sp. NPDC058335]|uniref:hypothetical protein n=1 Tax=Streptomyces sp. NPDC058335 TaxID=3346451 RepID=UPI003651C7BA